MAYKSTFFILLMLMIFQLPEGHSQNATPDSILFDRIQSVQNSLIQDELKTRHWWYGWLYAYGAATLGQGAVFLISENKSMRQDMALGAITTALGAANQFISPIKPNNRELKDLAFMDESNEMGKMQKLRYAEELLKLRAIREKEARNWKAHALTGAVNLGGGLITWLGFKRTIWAGMGNFALNTVVTEVQIWTQPLKAKRDYESYCKKYLNPDYPLSYKADIEWYFNAYPGGAGIRVVFN